MTHKWIVSPNKLNEAYLQFGQDHTEIYQSFPKLTNLSVSGGFNMPR